MASMVILPPVALLQASAALTCAAVHGSPAQRDSVRLAVGNLPTGSAAFAIVGAVRPASSAAADSENIFIALPPSRTFVISSLRRVRWRARRRTARSPQ